MLTRWLSSMAFLAAAVDPHRAAFGSVTLTVAMTHRVKVHPDVELSLKCGDGKKVGVVQYWHTPFGEMQMPGTSRKLDPVFMQPDGSLVVPSTSSLHSGMYYCLLQHSEGTTLWPVELHVCSNNQKKQEHSGEKRHDVFRFRRDAGSVEERQSGISGGQFAGAVAASVLLTFVVGFSAGALTRPHVLRCFRAVTRLQSLQQQRCHGSEVTMTTLPPMFNSQDFEMEQVWDNDNDNNNADSTNCVTMESTVSSTTTSPPAKPQRSFRENRQEEETTAYLEGCDYNNEGNNEEKEKGSSLKGKNYGSDGEAEGEKEFRGFYLFGEDGESQTETDEDGEERKESRREEEEDRNKENEEEKGGREEGEEREQGENDVELKTGKDGGEDLVSSGTKTQDDTVKNGIMGGGGETQPCPGRRSRVIRLYQYDEDGHRYGHLPDIAPGEPGPAPRLKQRSLSLTRLNAIMAAASAGPLDTRQTERGEGEGRPHFHMEI